MITQYGKAVRKARVDIGSTLQKMSEALGVSAAYLSAVENGKKKIPRSLICEVTKYFSERGVSIPNLQTLADVSNKEIRIEELPPAQQVLVAKFARSTLTEEQIQKAEEFFDKLIGENKPDADK